MDDRGPSCDAATLPLASKDRLVVRLQLWHFCRLGRSKKMNRLLARHFADLKLANWDVHDVAILEPEGRARRDYFVPVEVDFEHKYCTYHDTNGSAESDVRELFQETVPQAILPFLSTSESQDPVRIMKVSCINTQCPSPSRYTHVTFLSRLPIKVETILMPTSINVSHLSLLVSAGHATMPQILELLTLFSQITADRNYDLSFLSEAHAEALFNIKTAVAKASLLIAVVDRVIVNFLQYLLLEMLMDLSALERKMGGVVENIKAIQGHSAFTHYRQQLQPQLKDRLHEMESTLANHEMAQGAGMLATVLGAGTGAGGMIPIGAHGKVPASIAAVAACFGVGFGLVTAFTRQRIIDIRHENIVTVHFKENLEALGDSLNDTRAALAIIFCRDALNVDLQDLGVHERIKVFEGLGVDGDRLGKRCYEESDITVSLQKFVRRYERLAKSAAKLTGLTRCDIVTVEHGS
ncbi:hypothetical protein B0I35DRAFT_481463 [Stachybotrys elegans]|uniref:Uncharacterized protein n=1 Tax=Stachybotrys elegans TaxID=80388 RepID=A0A8K0SL83_9HYPO|nr:hypothetical protein B0I35DRAFT_481463 [Stachybotrys elegans]